MPINNREIARRKRDLAASRKLAKLQEEHRKAAQFTVKSREPVATNKVGE